MYNEQKKEKLLLMGRQGAGKTSMHSIIFANYPAKETMGIGYTIDVDKSSIRFMDCGGQDKLMRHYFSSQSENIFSNASVLIYVIDGYKSFNNEKAEEEMEDFIKSCNHLSKYSSNCRIFVLIHKFDQIPLEQQDEFFNSKKEEIIQKTKNLIKINQIFKTSIFDASLYKSWSIICQQLFSNMGQITKSLQQFCELNNLQEIIIFEKQTFLIINYFNNNNNNNNNIKSNQLQRYEILSNTIKNFKLRCRKQNCFIKKFQLQTKEQCLLLDEYTQNTYILMVLNKKNSNLTIISENLEQIKKILEEFQGNEQEQLGIEWKK